MTHVKEALFQKNVSFDPQKNAWTVVIKDGNKNNTLYFNKKPVWLDTIDKMNDILLKNPDPIGLRKVHDNIDRLSLKSFNKYNQSFTDSSLENYLLTIHSKRLLSDVRQIFKLKHKDEELSCINGGSMPSSQCGTIWRLTGILNLLDPRIKDLDRSLVNGSLGTSLQTPKPRFIL